MVDIKKTSVNIYLIHDYRWLTWCTIPKPFYRLQVLIDLQLGTNVQRNASRWLDCHVKLVLRLIWPQSRYSSLVAFIGQIKVRKRYERWGSIFAGGSIKHTRLKVGALGGIGVAPAASLGVFYTVVENTIVANVLRALYVVQRNLFPALQRNGTANVRWEECNVCRNIARGWPKLAGRTVHFAALSPVHAGVG